MIIFDGTTYYFYDEGNSTVQQYRVPELQAQIEQLQAILPEDLTQDDVKLLTWAKGAFQYSPEGRSRDQIVSQISAIQTILAEIEEFMKTATIQPIMAFPGQPTP